MGSIARNCRILADPAGTSLAMYKSNFRRFVCMDVIYAVLFGATSVLSIAGKEGALGPEFSAGGGLLMAEVLPAAVACLFLLDAVLMIMMNRNIAKWPGGVTAASLHKIVNINIFTNGLSIIVYIAWRIRNVLNVLGMGETKKVIGSNGIYFTIGIFALVATSKVTKVLVIWAFHRWLQAQPDASMGQLLPGTLPATAVAQPMAPSAPLPATGYQQHQAFQQSQA